MHSTHHLCTVRTIHAQCDLVPDGTIGCELNCVLQMEQLELQDLTNTQLMTQIEQLDDELLAAAADSDEAKAARVLAEARHNEAATGRALAVAERDQATKARVRAEAERGKDAQTTVRIQAQLTAAVESQSEQHLRAYELETKLEELQVDEYERCVRCSCVLCMLCTTVVCLTIACLLAYCACAYHTTVPDIIVASCTYLYTQHYMN